MVDEINDVRIIGVITAIVMMGIALAGLSWESKVMRCSGLLLPALI